jgi:hypothetical protein
MGSNLYDPSNTLIYAYYALQPEIRKNHWLLETEDYIEDNITNLPFNRVWMYSYTKY